MKAKAFVFQLIIDPDSIKEDRDLTPAEKFSLAVELGRISHSAISIPHTATISSAKKLILTYQTPCHA